MPIEAALCDSREPLWVQELQFDNIPTTVCMLEAGDLHLLMSTGEILGIERKDSNDFLNTLRADRLFPQMEKLRSLSPWAYLVVAGTLQCGQNGKAITDRIETGFNWASVAGALLTCQEIGVHIIQCHESDFRGTVLRIAHRERRSLRVQPARDTVLLSEAEIFLTALPGIGPDKADTILKRCGSAAWGLSLLTNLGIEGTPGIGDGIKRKVRHALGLAEEEVLNVVNYKTGNPVSVGEL